ncbi:hypothetical protein [Clostridium estertheticum]|uniref:hypothetical protein n=1 Tax=Clostridium estertheticum TaxID=238834 RepID=UPI001C0CCB12|nr:hypothetical protein [Clostridium estertheticum]MBU3186602.1 hypothetical protein [Clostridium estertheticum]
MLSEFEVIRNDIRDTRIFKKNYVLAINKCNSCLKLLNSVKNKSIKSDKWFCYHNMALSNKKLNNYNEAIKNELLAMNNTNGKTDFRYFSSLWMIAECNVLLGNNSEALKLYSECSSFYKYIEDDNLRTCIVWNKAKVYKNVRAMLRLIKIYETKNFNQVVKTYGDFEYDDILTEMYKDLFNQYVESDNRSELFKLTRILKDKTLRKELRLRLVA